jgi:hypothetical protein
MNAESWHHRFIMMNPHAVSPLRGFRSDFSACCTKRAGALVELADAASTGGPTPSLAHLSWESAQRRGWGRLDAALEHGRSAGPALQALLARQPFPEGEPMFAVAARVWPRCDAETRPDRGFSYHPARHSHGQPIVAGWADQWIAPLSLQRASGAAPLDVRRIHPSTAANTEAVAPITALLPRRPVDAAVPLVVCAAGSAPLPRAQGRADTRAAILLRLRSDRCFSADPPPTTPGRNGGRPRRPGAQFALEDPSTWFAPPAEDTTADPPEGTGRGRAGAGVPAKTPNQPTRGARGPRPFVRGTVLLVEVTRRPGRTQKPQVLWLGWFGPETADLALLGRAGVPCGPRRFASDPTRRFFQQTLNWVTPRVRHPEPADRWTWRVAAASTQLRLAREGAADQRLPGQQPLDPPKRTPGRVRQGLWRLVGTVGTLASPPKPSGRSPGRPQGRAARPAPRSPTSKKAAERAPNRSDLAHPRLSQPVRAAVCFNLKLRAYPITGTALAAPSAEQNGGG